MRVTQNFFFESIRFQSQVNAESLLRIQEQIATQKRINRISDDTIEAPRLLDVKAGQARNEQFLKNIERASSVNDIYDQVLGQADSLLGRAKELLIGEANEVTSTPETREAARVEIASITSQLVQLANTQFNDVYIFSGFAVDVPAYLDASVAGVVGGGNTGGGAITMSLVENPSQVQYNTAYDVQFTAPGVYDVINTTTGQIVQTGQAYTSGQSIFFDGLEIAITDSPGAPNAGDIFTFTTSPPGTYQGDAGQQQVEIQTGTFIQQNLRGDRVFEGVGIAGGIDVFQILADINTALNQNDRTSIENGLDLLNTSQSQFSSERASVGSKLNLIESVQNRQTEVKFSLETLRSSIEDLDMTEAVTRLNQAQIAFESTLSVAGRILDISLLDFLR